MLKPQTIDRLVQGIQSIVSDSRSSLSDEEVALLKECVTFLEIVKSTEDFESPIVFEIVARVVEILLRVLLSDGADNLKDLLFN